MPRLLGLIGVLALALTALPTALPGFAALLPASASGWFEALMSGPPQVIGAIAAGIGIGVGASTLLIDRQHERSAPAPTSAPLHIIGVLLVPVLFFGGLLLLLRGLGGAGQSHLLQAGIVTDPFWMPALIGGFALILAAILQWARARRRRTSVDR